MPFDAVQALAATVASVAAIIDLRTRRIPNWVTAAALIAGLVVHTVQDGAGGLGMALAGAALGAAILLPFYIGGVMGAGDVKLLAALGALLGPQLLVSV